MAGMTGVASSSFVTGRCSGVECGIVSFVRRRCDKEFHLACLSPPLPRAPPGKWECDLCAGVAVGTGDGAGCRVCHKEVCVCAPVCSRNRVLGSRMLWIATCP